METRGSRGTRSGSTLFVTVALATVMIVGIGAIALPEGSSSVAQTTAGVTPSASNWSTSAQEVAIAVFHNQNGFQVPCLTTLLPDGTVAKCDPHYAIRITSTKPAWLRSLLIVGGGLTKNVTGGSYLGQQKEVVYLTMPDVLKGGDDVSIVLALSPVAYGTSISVQLNNVTVVETTSALV